MGGGEEREIRSVNKFAKILSEMVKIGSSRLKNDEKTCPRISLGKINF